MRYQINKRQSTKPERIVYQALNELRIPFKHRWLIDGREIDFVVGNYAIEIDGHEQDVEKNNQLARLGYTPIHLHNSEITKDTIKKLIKQYDYKT